MKTKYNLKKLKVNVQNKNIELIQDTNSIIIDYEDAVSLVIVLRDIFAQLEKKKTKS